MKGRALFVPVTGMTFGERIPISEKINNKMKVYVPKIKQININIWSKLQ